MTMDRADHILIVDDDADIRSLLTRYLEKNGLRATAVGDGRAMWQALDRGAFDLVVLDLMLPGDDGLTLCRTLRGKSDIPSSCSPHAATRPTASSAWRWAPTTTCPSPSARANCWHASRSSCAARAACRRTCSRKTNT